MLLVPCTTSWSGASKGWRYSVAIPTEITFWSDREKSSMRGLGDVRSEAGCSEAGLQVLCGKGYCPGESPLQGIGSAGCQAVRGVGKREVSADCRGKNLLLLET
jgi:hypothetical protein